MFGRHCGLRRTHHLDVPYRVANSIQFLPIGHKENFVADSSIVRFPYFDRPNGDARVKGLFFGGTVVYVLEVTPSTASTLIWNSPVGYNEVLRASVPVIAKR